MLKKLKNKFEKRIYQQLKKAKVRFSYESERIPYVLARHYVPDFIIRTDKGVLYVECKGYFRPEAKAKMAAIKRQHPQLDIRLLFYSKVRSNIKWAEKVGFKYAIGTIPEEWLK